MSFVILYSWVKNKYTLVEFTLAAFLLGGAQFGRTKSPGFCFLSNHCNAFLLFPTFITISLLILVCFDRRASMTAWNQNGEFHYGGMKFIYFFYLVCEWLALTTHWLKCYLRSVLGPWPFGIIIWLGTTNALFCFLLHLFCRLKKRTVGINLRRSQKIQEKWQSPKRSILLVRKSSKLGEVTCPLWAQCKLSAAVLGAGWSWALKHIGSSSHCFFFFYCEHIQISGKMRPRFSCVRAAGYSYMQTSVFTQIHNIHNCNSNSLRLPHLTGVYNGWQSSLVTLALGRLRHGRKHIWSHGDEGNTFYSFSLVQVLCCEQDIGWHFPWWCSQSTEKICRQ